MNMTLATFAGQLIAFELFLCHVLTVALLLTVLTCSFPLLPMVQSHYIDTVKSPLCAPAFLLLCNQVFQYLQVQIRLDLWPTRHQDIRVVQWRSGASDYYH